MQLNIYAAGYQKATGKDADLVEIHNLEMGHTHREAVQGKTLANTLDQVINAGNSIKAKNLPKHKSWCKTCSSCDMAGICRTKQAKI